jgi:hypothetical protein
MSEEENDPPVDTESEESSEESEEETPDEPATPLITNQTLSDVTNQLDNFHLEMGDNQRGRNPTPAPTAERVAVSNGSFKVNPPSEFSGQRNQVKTFKLQCLTYLHLNNDKLNNDRKRLLFLTSYLRGPAYEWILPHLEDYLDHPDSSDQKATTRSILANAATFFEELQTAFGYGSEKMEAERALQSIQQRGPVSKYKAEFQTLVVKTSWDDQAITSHFYRGLKDVIKDEIARRDSRPATFQEMYEIALKIDERIYERQMEKKGVYRGGANTKVQRDVPAWNNNYYGLQKMQLDATKGKPGSNNNNNKGSRKKRPQSKTKGTTDKSSVECYGCGKKGHYKSECNARKQRHDLQGSGQHQPQDKSFRATKSTGNEIVEQTQSLKATQGRGGYQEMEPIITQDPHGMESWTACFDDNCAIHLSDKFGSGYWPAKKTRSVCRTIGQPGQVVRYTAGYPPQEESSTEEESSEEEGEIAESDGEMEEPELFEFTRTADKDDAILRILTLVWESKNSFLPWNDDGDVQQVNESELWELFGSIRKSLWSMPHEKHSTDYYRIVQEFPPLGSNFTARGGYFTPEDICISKSLRDRVKGIKEEYAKELVEQKDRLLPPGQAPIEVRPVAFAEPIIPNQYLQAPREVQRRPATPYARNTSVWEPALNTSDPNYVPRRPISMQGTQAEGSLDPRRQLVMGRTQTWNTGN